MRTARQHKVDFAILAALLNAQPYALPRSIMLGDAGRLVVPRPTVAEIDAALAYHETDRRIVGIQGETEPKYKITDDGRAWHAEHA